MVPPPAGDLKKFRSTVLLCRDRRLGEDVACAESECFLGDLRTPQEDEFIAGTPGAEAFNLRRKKSVLKT